MNRIQQYPNLFGVSSTQLRPPVFYMTADNPSLYPINATYGDEMDGATINAGWTKRNIAETESLQAGSSLRGTPTSSDALRLTFDAQGDGIWRPAPSGDFEIVCGIRNLSAYGLMLSLAVINSSGTGVGVSPYNDGNAYTWNISTYNYSSTGTSLGAVAPAANAPYWLALKKVGTTYTARFSANGTTFTSGTNITSAITVDRIGIGRIFTTGGSLTADITRFNTYTVSPYFVPLA